MIKDLFNKYYKYVIVLIVGIAIGAVLCSSKVEAAERSYLEFGADIVVEQVDEFSTSNTQFYIEGFHEIHRLFDGEFRINTGLDGGELSDRAEGYGALWVTPIKSDKGRFACGAKQFASYSDSSIDWESERVVNCHGRLNF